MLILILAQKSTVTIEISGLSKSATAQQYEQEHCAEGVLYTVNGISQNLANCTKRTVS